MDKILHDPKDPKLWELWYIPYYGSCRILSISRRMPSNLGIKRVPFLVLGNFKGNLGLQKMEKRPTGRPT